MKIPVWRQICRTVTYFLFDTPTGCCPSAADRYACSVQGCFALPLEIRHFLQRQQGKSVSSQPLLPSKWDRC